MADLINIRLFDHGPQRIGRGLRMIAGSCSGSASAYVYDTSKIEKMFHRCFAIVFDRVYQTSAESGFFLKWVASTSHLNGHAHVLATCSRAASEMSTVMASNAQFIEQSNTNPIMTFTAWGI